MIVKRNTGLISPMQSLAIYGGSFDPVHKAHLATALAIQAFFHFDLFYFVPCKAPLLKQKTRASAKARVEMLTLALKDHLDFQVDLREINRASPSYMVETLESFRQDFPQATMSLIIGYDAFLSLPGWHQWEKLITLTNLLVMHRAGTAQVQLPEPLVALLKQHETKQYMDLLKQPFGKIACFDAGSLYLSSSEIRSRIQQGESVEDYLSVEVDTYIRKHQLYR